eukprot:355041-Chlamydomonas_euryale.AAC.8
MQLSDTAPPYVVLEEAPGACVGGRPSGDQLARGERGCGSGTCGGDGGGGGAGGDDDDDGSGSTGNGSSGSDDDSSDDQHPEAPEHALSLWDASKANPHARFVQQLVDAGADVNARDANAWTPLHVAAYYGQEDVCNVLVRAAGVDLDCRNKHEETPLHLAAKWPHDKAAEALCAGGADPNAVSRRGRTPLHTAALFARRAVVERLVAAGASQEARMRAEK